MHQTRRSRHLPQYFTRALCVVLVGLSAPGTADTADTAALAAHSAPDTASRAPCIAGEGCGAQASACPGAPSCAHGSVGGAHRSGCAADHAPAACLPAS